MLTLNAKAVFYFAQQEIQPVYLILLGCHQSVQVQNLAYWLLNWLLDNYHYHDNPALL
jgi:hypothetical protein